jgi:tRNA threonylcarbamoyladenosine biosynthesis protein TsaE
MSISRDKTLSVITRSPSRTIELGRRLGRLLAMGDVVALYGDLGSGKTVLIKGIALGCGVRDVAHVTSPTFILMNEYGGRVPFYHFDAFRLGGADELVALGAHEYFEGRGVCAVEWAERVQSALPEDRINIRAWHVGTKTRRFDFAPNGAGSAKIIAKFKRAIRNK